MNAADVMVSNVIAVSPDATVQEVAEILLKNKISAVPVVSQSGKILGIVSEGDLLRRVESHTLRHRSWWLQLLTANTVLRDEFVKSHSHKVIDVMTPKVLTVSPETPLGEIASVLEKNGIKRVPVVKDGKLVGTRKPGKPAAGDSDDRKDDKAGGHRGRCDVTRKGDLAIGSAAINLAVADQRHCP